MIKHYENKSIYRILKAVMVFAIISLILSVLSIMGYFFNKYYAKPSVKIEWFEIFDIIIFVPFMILLPLHLLIFTKTNLRDGDQYPQKPPYDSKTMNDISTTLFAALIPLLALLVLGCQGIKGLCFFGYMLFPHFFYVPNLLLIINCILIKCEWKKNPPYWKLTEQKRKEQERKIQKQEKDKIEIERLLNVVGKRFFVELYFKLRDWSEIDVLDDIRKEYGEDSARQRISKGKEIFGKGLEIRALQTISVLPDDKIDENTKRKATDLLKLCGKERNDE